MRISFLFLKLIRTISYDDMVLILIRVNILFGNFGAYIR